MPLNEIARGYADRLFQNSLEEIHEANTKNLIALRSEFAKTNMPNSGGYYVEHARLLIERIRLLGEAKASSLITAYEKSGLAYDEVAFHDINSEVINFCRQQQHNAVSAMGTLIRQQWQNAPSSLEPAVVQEIVSGISGVMSRISRNLQIRLDESLLEDMKTKKAYAAGLGKKWDVFVCHAGEDKNQFVRPLANALDGSGLSVWYDEFTLNVGDSLRRKIDEGLANSRYGIVVLSRKFFEKGWPQQELDGLMAWQVVGNKLILPVWYKITSDEVRARSPLLAGIVAARSEEGLEVVVEKIRSAMGLERRDGRDRR
jgi:hypothetical protein